MLAETTISKLHELRLGVMAGEFKRQLADLSVKDLPFEDRVGLLVDREWDARISNRLKRLIKNASYAVPGACVENIAYNADRKLDKALIASLASCSYIQENHNVIIMGATGAGKTYLACALGMAANRRFYTVKYVRLPDLFVDLAIAREKGCFRSVMNQYANVRLLILDEWLLYPPGETEARDLLEIVNARHSRASTVFCSQFGASDWYAQIGRPALAEAVCDRIVHNAYSIVISGESMRKRNGITC